MAFSTRHFQAHHSGARSTERGAVPVSRWNYTSGGVASTMSQAVSTYSSRVSGR